MWQRSSGALDTNTPLSHRKRLAPRERSLEETQSVCVSSVPMSQLWMERFDLSQWLIELFWSAGESSIGDVFTPPGGISEHPAGPPLPPPCYNPVFVPPQQPLVPRQPGSDHFADDHSVHTIPQSPADRLSADDASFTPSSRRS